MTSIYLRLDALQPMDILLTAGTSASSWLIRAAQFLGRRRRAKYSHAALFLGPTLKVEALTKRGIVCTDLTDSLPERAPTKNEPSLSFRWIDGRLAVFARIPDVRDAAVFRHRELMREGPYDSAKLQHLRRRLLPALEELYLKQYSLITRLAIPVVDLDPKMQSALDRISRSLEKGKLEPGPFCSELVCKLIQSVEDAGYGSDHESIGPSELSWNGEYLKNISRNAVVHGVSDLPGSECPSELSSELLSMLKRGPTGQQENLAARMLQVSALCEKIFKASGGTPQEYDHAKSRSELRGRWVNAIERHLVDGPDPVWTWIQKANACLSNCVENRALKQRSMNLPQPTTKPFEARTLQQTWAEELHNWDGRTACSISQKCVLHRYELIVHAHQRRVDQSRIEQTESIRLRSTPAGKSAP